MKGTYIARRCISYYSYIKPQQRSLPNFLRACCISYYSYIKPQHKGTYTNMQLSCISYYSYIKPQREGRQDEREGVVYRTIPTSNHNPTWKCESISPLYIVLFLHQTTTGYNYTTSWGALYIVLFLHQTTTYSREKQKVSLLYIVLFLHQTTTYNGDIADNQHVTITFINKK